MRISDWCSDVCSSDLAILDDSDAILEANAQDMRAGRNAKLDAALLERLELNAKRVEAMADGVRQVALLPEPVGEITDMKQRPSGIKVGHTRVPLGVVGIIFESRPHGTADATALGTKSGTADKSGRAEWGEEGWEKCK